MRLFHANMIKSVYKAGDGGRRRGAKEKYETAN